MDIETTLDLPAIRVAQRALGVSCRKHERAVRDARAALAAARDAVSEALRRARAAMDAVEQAEHAYRVAVSACATVTDGHAMAARVRWCEHSARAIVERVADVQRAQAAVASARHVADQRSRDLLRAERRLDEAGRTLSRWRQREQLAIETHADLALEDDPRPRTPETLA